MIAAAVIDELRAIVGAEFVRLDDASLIAYGTDALKRGRPADAVVMPANTAEIAAIARLCNETRTPLVPRGAGTGYTGGAVPLHGGVVLTSNASTRFSRSTSSACSASSSPMSSPATFKMRSSGWGCSIPRPCESASVGHRRQCGRVRRGAARIQVQA